MLDPDELIELHRRLQSGDPTASADLFIAVLDPLARYLLKWKGVDIDLARDLAVEVLASIVSHPERFDPTKGHLFGYLCGAAKGDLFNHFRKTSWRRQKFDEHVVELQTFIGNSVEIDPGRRLDAVYIWENHLSEIAQTDEEVAVLSMMLMEEKDNEAFAEALGLSGSPEAERLAEVKRCKDRLEKRLRRLGDRL